MIIHMIINFVHGMIPIFLMKHLDLDSYQDLQDIGFNQLLDPETQAKVLKMYADPMFTFLVVYAMFILAVVIVGIILLIINFKKMKVDDSASPVNKSNAFSTIYLNPGMIIFLILVVAATIYESI